MSESRLVSPEFVAGLAAASPLITVIGDVILDGWWNGRIDRVSREAPAPVLEVTGREFAPGGAANVAMNLVALGARARIVGLVGDDEAGARVRSMLEAAGVDTQFLIVDAAAVTTTKTRVMSADQILLRIDELAPLDVALEMQRRLASASVLASAGADAEIVSDYGRGSASAVVLDALASRAERPPLTIVDAHDPRVWAALHPDVITPNADEFSRATGIPLPSFDRAEAVGRHAALLLEATGARAAVVTLDRDGTFALSPDGVTHRTFAHPTVERQASGAGDSFVAAMTVALACAATLPLAATIGQLAADIVVDCPGTAVCTSADMLARIAQPTDPSLGIDELAARLVLERASGARIVFTNGCFDVLHRGHTTSLRQAKQLGGVLVVAINDDDSVRRLKGSTRPANSAVDRAAVLEALGCVDYVTVFSADTPLDLIERLRPDVYAKGGDYSPEMLQEAQAVLAYGGEVAILDYVPDHSTSELFDRMRVAAPPAGSAGGAASVAGAGSSVAAASSVPSPSSVSSVPSASAASEAAS